MPVQNYRQSFQEKEMDLKKRLCISEDLYAQSIDDETVLLDMRSENYYGLDATASRIWRLLSSGLCIHDAINRLEELYDVERSRLEADVSEFVEILIADGLAHYCG